MSRAAARVVVAAIVMALSSLLAASGRQTPAHEAFNAWLAAFNSNDPAALEKFVAERGGGQRMGDALQWRSGGFRLLEVEQSQPQRLTALLEERYSDAVARLVLAVNDGQPPKVTEWSLEPIQRPAGHAIQRRGQAELLQELDARAKLLSSADQLSGAMLVARHGRPIYERAWGAADRAQGVAASTRTKFRLGSMNKMFTAVAVLRLVEAGQLSLDAPIGTYLRDYPGAEVAKRVTIRHLLTHTGATGDIFGPEFARERLQLREHADYIRLFGARAPAYEPGDRYQYSNYGFVLLGAVLERVSGRSYYDQVRASVFEPAGMRDTASLPETDTVSDRALGYTRRGGAWISNADSLPWRGTAAGGGYSTAHDLLAFATALERGTLLKPDTLRLATTPHMNGYGFGMMTRGEGKFRSYGHNGGAPGMNAELRIMPELGYVVVVLSNLDPPAASRLANFFLNRVAE